MRIARFVSAVVMLVVASVTISAGQQPGRVVSPIPPPAPAAPAPQVVPPAPPAPPAQPAAPANAPQMARIDLVLTRFQGEKKVSSHPYSFYVGFGANTNGSTTLSVGTEVPTPFQPGTNGGKTYTYQTVGVDIYAQVRQATDGRYFLTLNCTDTSAAEAPRNEPILANMLPVPVLRSWSMNNSLLIRDGQMLPFGSVVDRLSGEIVKSEVTFTIIR